MPVTARNGYTLIELALVIAILGVLIGSGLAMFTKSGDAQRYQATQHRLEQIDRAVLAYAAMHGFLPCPASGEWPSNSPNFGIAAAYSAVTPSACDAPQSSLPNELLGVVPTRTLGLPDEAMLDGWGRRISYQTATGLGSARDFKNDQNKGDLQVLNAQGVRATNLEFGAAYVLISHGKNGYFAWLNSLQSAQRLTPVPASLAGIENQNASGADRLFMLGALTKDFDDLLFFRNKGQVLLNRAMMRPMEMQSVVCTHARTIVNLGRGPFTTLYADDDPGAGTTINPLYQDHADRLYSTAIAIDRYCSRGVAASQNKRCPRNMLWLGDATDPDTAIRPTTPDPELKRNYPNCYCPGAVNPPTVNEKFIQTNYMDEQFGACE